MEYTLTEDNFQQEVLESDQPVLVDFYADWCGPCKMMAPVVERLADKYQGRVKVGKVNVDENPGLARTYRVMSIPNFVMFKGGKVADTAIGGMPQEALDAKVAALL